VSARPETARGRARRRRRRRGLSLIELMVALAISTALLASVGAAFHASAGSIETNDRISRATQAARITLLQLLSEVRIGLVDSDDSTTTEMTVLVTDPNDPTVTLRDRTYKLVGRELRMYTNDDPSDDVGGVPGSHVLCRNVVALAFNKQVIKDENDNLTDLTARVAITITVDVDANGDGQGDGNAITISGSATPRKSLRY
jgi:prepilin-type N-terminal cleavage/methylation domain-containing protein